MYFGYDFIHALSYSVVDINDLAIDIISRLDNERYLELIKKRLIIFITYSLRGVIIKRALILVNKRSDL